MSERALRIGRMRKKFHRLLCWLFGCRMVPVAYYRNEYNGLPSSCTVYCFRCDTFGACDL